MNSCVSNVNMLRDVYVVIRLLCIAVKSSKLMEGVPFLRRLTILFYNNDITKKNKNNILFYL